MKKLLTLLLGLFIICTTAIASDTTSVSVQTLNNKSATLSVIDSLNGIPVSATISNINVQNNNTSVASIAVAGRTITVTGVSAGTGTAIVSCHIDYTDRGDGQPKSEDKTIVIAYTVTLPPPHGIKLLLVFN